MPRELLPSPYKVMFNKPQLSQWINSNLHAVPCWEPGEILLTGEGEEKTREPSCLILHRDSDNRCPNPEHKHCAKLVPTVTLSSLIEWEGVIMSLPLTWGAEWPRERVHISFPILQNPTPAAFLQAQDFQALPLGWHGNACVFKSSEKSSSERLSGCVCSESFSFLFRTFLDCLWMFVLKKKEQACWSRNITVLLCTSLNPQLPAVAEERQFVPIAQTCSTNTRKIRVKLVSQYWNQHHVPWCVKQDSCSNNMHNGRIRIWIQF